MYPDPLHLIRSSFGKEIESHYKQTRLNLHQQIWGEITRPQINLDQITRYIDDNLNVAGNRTTGSAWRYLDNIVKLGISHAQGQIDRNASVLASYTNADKNRTDILIDLCQAAVGNQNEKLKAEILKLIKNTPANTVLMRNIRDTITQKFIPGILEVVQTYASRAYNEGVWSRISMVAPRKKWCFVSDYRGAEYHLPMNDQIVDIDKPFLLPPIDISKTKEIPGVEMMFPHDCSNKPNQYHINGCQCFIVAVF